MRYHANKVRFWLQLIKEDLEDGTDPQETMDRVEERLEQIDQDEYEYQKGVEEDHWEAEQDRLELSIMEGEQ